MRYTLLLADADGTLFDFHAGERVALTETFAAFGVPVDDAIAALYSRVNLSHWKRLERGETTQPRLRVERFADCVRELRFERLGVFRYSAEEGTPAAELPGQVPEEVKQERYEAVMALQEGISQQLCQDQVGQRLRVIVDGRDESGMMAGRTMGQAPDIDGVTYLSAKKDLTSGSFHDVLIKDAYEYDLLGEVE